MKTNNTENKLSLREKIVYSLIGVGILGSGIYFGKRFVANKVSGNEEKKSFEDGTSATYAKQLKMAFDNDGWWGTNTDMVRTTLRAIPSKQEFTKVQDSYKKLYNKNLISDLSNELQSTEYNEMLQIIAQKPDKTGGKPVSSTLKYEAWAKRLKTAFDKTYGFLPGTDENAIKAVFNEMSTQKDFGMTAVVYKKLYGNDLIADLKSELELWEYNSYLSAIRTKPKG